MLLPYAVAVGGYSSRCLGDEIVAGSGGMGIHVPWMKAVAILSCCPVQFVKEGNL